MQYVHHFQGIFAVCINHFVIFPVCIHHFAVSADGTICGVVSSKLLAKLAVTSHALKWYLKFYYHDIFLISDILHKLIKSISSEMLNMLKSLGWTFQKFTGYHLIRFCPAHCFEDQEMFLLATCRYYIISNTANNTHSCF